MKKEETPKMESTFPTSPPARRTCLKIPEPLKENSILMKKKWDPRVLPKEPVRTLRKSLRKSSNRDIPSEEKCTEDIENEHLH